MTLIEQIRPIEPYAGLDRRARAGSQQRV